jgi:hypothetical protein
MTTQIVIYVVVALAVLVAALFAFAATRPNEFRVQRTARIKAAPGRIFTEINDFHHWAAWSPFEKLDPAMKKTYSGAASGQGAVYEWEGNSKAGKGRMEITDAAAPSRVAMKLDFLKPFESHCVTEFTLEPRGDSTDVTWSMYGPNLFMAKVMGIFVNMDNMIGKDFAAGLANLKAIAEK